MSLPPWLNITLQIVAALIIIIVLYIVTLFTLNIDSIVVNTGSEIKAKDSTTIVDGYASPSFLYDLEYNTVNPMVENYKRISRSANASGGASFTYQFWMKVEDSNDELFKDLVLFIKGDKKKYNLGYYSKVDSPAPAPSPAPAASPSPSPAPSPAPAPATGNSQYKLLFKMPPDAYVACPAISFGDSYRQIKIRFNTNNDIYNEIFINMNVDAEPSARKNLLSLLPLNWTLLTFVFEDNYSIVDSSENGIKVSFYINDTPYWIESASSTPIFRNDFFKQNDGNIYFLPNLKISTDFMKMANVKYYNYAVDQADIKQTYLRGPPSYPATRNDEKSKVKPSFVSALNKVDIYNY